MTARVSAAKSKDGAQKGKSGKVRLFVALIILVAVGVQYTKLDESKQRFIMHLAKQVPYLPGRYYA
ncbi:MAG: hypothetical protein JW854_09895 [Actinobacteria bacterium]|nr:hypothetical protein [Actinomycetota bacterium]